MYGKRFLDNCADENLRERKEKVETERTIDDLTWTGMDQKKLSVLETDEKEVKKGGKELPQRKRDTIEKLREKKSHKLTPEEQKKLDDAYETRDGLRREYLREKTKRLAADHLRICDLKYACKAAFSYALVEMNADEMDTVKKAFEDDVNKPWNGKLL